MYFLSKRTVFRLKSAVELDLESLGFQDDKERILHIKSGLSDGSAKDHQASKTIDLKRKSGYFINRKWAGSGEPPGLQIQ